MEHTDGNSAPVVVELSGGLGNQLFQYAFGTLVAELSRRPLFLDATSVHRDIQRNVDIRFLVPASKFRYINTRRELFSLLRTRVHCSLSRVEKLIHAFFPYKRAESGRHYTFLEERIENSFDGILALGDCKSKFFQKELGNLRQLSTANIQIPLFVRGYWQDIRYVEFIGSKIAEKIAIDKECTEIVEVALDILTNRYNIDMNHAVALHVRRTDFLSYPAYAQCEPQYYAQAVNKLKRRDKNAQFLVFTDDANWCLENFNLPVPWLLVSMPKNGAMKKKHDTHRLLITSKKLRAIDELLIMNHCRHSILSNSSFAWWGRFLSSKNANANCQSTVIAPFPWFADMRKSFRLYASEWIVLNAQDGARIKLSEAAVVKR